MNNVVCECGCKLFNDFRPFTIDGDTFMVWNLKEKITPSVYTIPIIQCVSCGRLIAPKASFGGKNILDEEVQLYAELLNYVKNRNSIIDNLTTSLKCADRAKEIEKNGTIETTSVSEENIEDAIIKGGAGSRSRKNNK